MSVSTRIAGVLFIRDWPEGYGLITFWCPGCEAGHTVSFGDHNTWTFDGDVHKPTFTPSVLSRGHPRSFDPARPDHDGPVPDMPTCHSFVTAGRIQYLNDSTHSLAGQTVDMVPLPERYARFMQGE